MLDKMPIIRKIIRIGKSSKAVIIPKSWLDFYERDRCVIEEVAIEVNRELRITPILQEDKD